MNQFLLQNISILTALMCPEAAPAEVPDLRRNGMLPDSAGPERVHGCSSCCFLHLISLSYFTQLHNRTTEPSLQISAKGTLSHYIVR